MGDNFGPGVYRTLSALKRQFTTVVWQDKKPPLHAEANLRDQVNLDRAQSIVQSMMPSGFILDPTRALHDYLFSKQWSNFFVLGNQRTEIHAVSIGSSVGSVFEGEEDPTIWANVNGWLIPVVGTNVSEEGDTRNVIKLYPPPETGGRVDLVFLEVWKALLSPNPSTTNKPTSSSLWTYGNVEYGGTNLPDDLEQPNIGFETSKRVQLQYRLRVYGSGTGLGAGVALGLHPDGLDDPNIFGQGAASTPVTGSGSTFNFANMREELGDPGLWRAGNGDSTNALGTVDGYTYAIPVAAVFRRNSNVFVAVSNAGNPNQNGAFNRNPSASNLPNPLDGAKELLVATLTNYLEPGTTGEVHVTNLNGSGFEDGDLDLESTFIVIDNEIMGISEVDAINELLVIDSRGRYGTDCVGHAAGTQVKFFNSRPDNLFADEIASTDVLDLRRGANPGDWDFKRILLHNVAALVQGNLRTAWKQSDPGDTEGPTITEVDYLFADGTTAVPNHTEALDGPDGIRYVWSDAATYQPDITLLLDNEAPVNSSNFTTGTLDATVEWDVGPDFQPKAFINTGPGNPPQSWTNGSILFLHIGGATGSGGARGTFRDGGTRAVRFVTPREFWESNDPESNQAPVSLRFLTERSHEPVEPISDPTTLATETPKHPGPYYSWRDSGFEAPFLVLGGILNSSLRITNVPTANLVGSSGTYNVDVGLDFDTPGGFFSKDSNGNFENDPTKVTTPLLRGQKTLFGMLTDDGKDQTGLSSDVYIIIYGDPDSSRNNGAFRVIGAGTAGYTFNDATNSTSLRVVPLSADFEAASGFDSGTGNVVTVEFRSQITNSEDGNGANAGDPAFALVMTDIGGELNHPWNRTTLGNLGIPTSGVGEDKVAVAAKAVLSTSLMYHPGRGGQARVADMLSRLALRSPTGTYLRQAPGSLDTTFPAFSGMPSNEVFYDPSHVQTWNRLPVRGWYAGQDAPSYGGNVVGFTEQDRENELFVDKGSKTLVYRPYRDRQMTLRSQTTVADPSLIGSLTYPDSTPKDGLGLFTSAKTMGLPVPREFMPKFGRQDIPFYPRQVATGNFLFGINHLFVDAAELTRPVFSIIGGENNTTGGTQVTPLFFVTGSSPGYGSTGTIVSPSGTVAVYGARKTSDIDPNNAAGAEIIERLQAVTSSDLGSGLKGLQLPPYLGIARLYGVYDKRDYDAKGGRTFKSNRYEYEEDSATNLLRLDADKQTLFILQDGAEDKTEGTGDHTYIVPLETIDISKSPYWVSGDEFEDYQYVVECTVFGFAKGWINDNNFVLVRANDGEGNSHTDGVDFELEGVHMLLPSPAALNDSFYVGYQRTVYQGDPYMTRAGETLTITDYENRYGQVPTASAHAVGTPIQQFSVEFEFDENCNLIPIIGTNVIEIPNARPFEVLASIDFYTTLGTGNIGGVLYPGTVLDVGHVENTSASASRIPSSSDSPAWRVLTRTFTEGQAKNTSRAEVGLQIVDVNQINPGLGSFAVLRIHRLDGTYLDLIGSRAVNVANALATFPGSTLNDIWLVAEDTTLVPVDDVVVSPYNLNLGSFVPGETKTYQDIAFAGVDVGDTIVLNQLEDISTPYGTFQVDAEVYAADSVRFRVTYTVTEPWALPGVAPGGLTPRMLATVTTPVVPPGTFAPITVPVPAAGVALGDTVIVSGTGIVGSPDLYAQNGLAVWASCTVAGQIDVSFFDLTGAGHPGGVNIPTFFTIVREVGTALDGSLDADFHIRAIKDPVSVTTLDAEETASNLTTTLVNHPNLEQSVVALSNGTTDIEILALPTGAQGNQLKASIYHSGSVDIETALRFIVPRSNERVVGAANRPPSLTTTNFIGGEDFPYNAGNGTTQLRLTGMTERLPLGILVQDSDFLGENPLGDDATAFKTSPSGIRPIQTLLPLTTGGEEFSRFLGEPGSLIAMADGGILRYVAFTDDTPTGSRRFRLYRGGGSAFVLSGENPGGPIDWVSESFPKTLLPVLKGGVLACKALLVRNFPEAPFSDPVKVTDGDEIQMIVITHSLYGNGNTQEEGITLSGIISPTGYGEGYAAADRYRCMGRPMFRAFTRAVTDPEDVTLAVFTEEGGGR